MTMSAVEHGMFLRIHHLWPPVWPIPVMIPDQSLTDLKLSCIHSIMVQIVSSNSDCFPVWLGHENLVSEPRQVFCATLSPPTAHKPSVALMIWLQIIEEHKKLLQTAKFQPNRCIMGWDIVPWTLEEITTCRECLLPPSHYSGHTQNMNRDKILKFCTCCSHI